MSIFDQSTKILIDMNEECESMKLKYGENSKFYKTRRMQIDTLIEMQDFATKKINELNRGLRLATINNKSIEMASEALIESLAAGIHTDQLFLLQPHGTNSIS
jgi:hypothetical protein